MDEGEDTSGERSKKKKPSQNLRWWLAAMHIPLAVYRYNTNTQQAFRAKKNRRGHGERVACIYSENQLSRHRPGAPKLHAQPAHILYGIDAWLYGHIRILYTVYTCSYISGWHKLTLTTPGLALFVQLRLCFNCMQPARQWKKGRPPLACS